MQITVLKSKISYAKITATHLYYVGSITIDSDIMAKAHLREFEQVQVVNLNNGERLMTYVIEGEGGSGIIALNGPAARKGMIGDELFILSYAIIDDTELCQPYLINLKNNL